MIVIKLSSTFRLNTTDRANDESSVDSDDALRTFKETHSTITIAKDTFITNTSNIIHYLSWSSMSSVCGNLDKF
jgi:hypothetical protein